MDEKALHVPPRLRRRARRRGASIARSSGVASAPRGSGTRAPQFLAIMAERALRQIADVVGEIGVDPVDDRLVRIIAVLPERDFAQEEVADRIDAVRGDKARRAHDVADRLRHLLAAVEQETVHDDLPRQGQSGRHEERRPVDCVKAGDVLADHMRVGRPESAPAGRRRGNRSR